MFWKKNKTIKTGPFKCSTCGETHDVLPAIGFKTPFHYDVLSEKDKNQIVEISDDFCVITHPEQTDRFIRCVMTIQVNDTCENLDYGIWVSLSEKSFNDYHDNYKTDDPSKTYFGTICNEISGYESTLGLHVNVVTRGSKIRPELIPHQADHQLIKDWESGISIEVAERRINEMMKNVG